MIAMDDDDMNTATWRLYFECAIIAVIAIICTTIYEDGCRTGTE